MLKQTTMWSLKNALACQVLRVGFWLVQLNTDSKVIGG